MTDRIPVSASRRSLSLAAWILVGVGGGGLISLLFFIPLPPQPGSYPPVPPPAARWFFFLLLVMAATGLAVPFVSYLNRRFGRASAAAGVLLRQALWTAIYFATCAWLQTNRQLTVALALLLAAGLGAIEWFLRLRERTRWTADESA